MTRLVSFLEYRLTGGELTLVLGSGQLKSVLGRKVETPYLRISMLDPVVVEVRVRCGTVQITDSGLSYDGWDDLQCRGASIRLFSWATFITRQIGTEKARFSRLLRETSDLWLEYCDGALVAVDESRARGALVPEDGAPVDNVFVEFHVPPGQADEVLSLMADSGPP